MILDLFKFGIIFFLPALIGKAFKLFREFRKIEFSILPWKPKRVFDKIVNSVVIIFIISKLASIFLFDSRNFFARTNCRIDSPSYVLRNHYRTYIENWAETNPEVANIVKIQDNSYDISGHEGKALHKDILNLQYLSEQLKSKEKKYFYSKFGENAFLHCDYCTNDYDYLLYSAPNILYEYSLFLILIGALSSSSHKSNWRIYGIFTAFISLSFEVYGLVFTSEPSSASSFEPFDAIFGDDMFTLRFEKILIIRNILFILFSIIAYILDNEKDMKLETIFDQLHTSLGTSLAFLQSTRIQNAAIAIDENLSKYVNEAGRLNKSKLASIISDPHFRQKVAETGHKLNLDDMLEQKDKNIEDLFKIIKHNNK